jgi:hypothetical protein
MPTRKQRSTDSDQAVAVADPGLSTDQASNGVVPLVEGPISIPQIQVLEMQIVLVGDSPLICHRFSEKAKQQMLDKQMKKAAQAKAAKDPQRDYEESLYPHPDGGYGFPCIGFKNAAVSACRFTDGLKMTEARGAFHVRGDLAKIEGTPTLREDTVRIAMGTADIRYRGEFKDWRVRLHIRYNAAVLSLPQIINLFNLAGFGVGVGEWRPERDGSYGLFHVASEDEID